MKKKGNIKTGIYIIMNTKTNTAYIGRAVDIKKRWDQHRSSLRHGYHSNFQLQHAWDEYGESAFAFDVLEYLDDQEELCSAEYFWINEYHEKSRELYNFDTVARNNLLNWYHIKGAKRRVNTCYFCGTYISPRFCFCKKCLKEHGLGKYNKWPEIYRELKRSLDREYKQDIRFEARVCDLELDEFGEEDQDIQDKAYKDWLTTDQTSLEDVLQDYDLTVDEFDIITTNNLKMLAKDLKIGYSNIKTKRYRLLKKLRAQNVTDGN